MPFTLLVVLTLVALLMICGGVYMILSVLLPEKKQEGGEEQ